MLPRGRGMSEILREVLEQTAARSGRLLLFLGSPLTFPPQLLRLIEAELEETTLIRAEPRLFGSLEGMTKDCALVFEDSVALRLLAGEQPQGCGLHVHAYRDPAMARQILRMDLQGCFVQPVVFLPLRMQISSFVALLRILLAGDVVIPLDLLAEPPLRQPGAGPPAATASIRLTPREAEVLELVACGQRNKLIARRLQLSEHTVKLHIHNIMSKIGATNRTEAAQWLQRARPEQSGGSDGKL